MCSVAAIQYLGNFTILRVNFCCTFALLSVLLRKNSRDQYIPDVWGQG